MIYGKSIVLRTIRQADLEIVSILRDETGSLSCR
jgi:hypothetical protein